MREVEDKKGRVQERKKARKLRKKERRDKYFVTVLLTVDRCRYFATKKIGVIDLLMVFRHFSPRRGRALRKINFLRNIDNQIVSITLIVIETAICNT